MQDDIGGGERQAAGLVQVEPVAARKPQDAEAKYFLSQFCALYYRRNRYTIQDDFSKSLYFLDGKLADGILDAYRKDDIIKKFITNTTASPIANAASSDICPHSCSTTVRPKLVTKLAQLSCAQRNSAFPMPRQDAS